MKKQFITIILLLMGGVSTFGQFILDGGTNPIRLRTDGATRIFIAPNSAIAPVLPGNVGIGTLSPPAKLTVVGDLALRKIVRETVAGGYNDYDRQDASIVIFENGGTISGIQGGSQGQMLYVLCGYGNNQSSLTIRHEASGNPTVANRILTHTGADFVIPSGAGGVLLIYDDAKQRWRIVESPSSSSAAWGLTGNVGTNPVSQFIGTTDIQPLIFKTSNVERMKILTAGNVGIGTPAPDTKLHVEGTVENNGTTATFKVTNGGSSMLFDGNEIDGASNGPIYLNSNSTGGVFIGVNGTGLKEIIKATVSVPTFTVSANLCSNQDISVANAAVDSAVSASPDNGITSGLFIAYARVSSAGIVRIRVCNFTAASITQSTSDFHVAVVR